MSVRRRPHDRFQSAAGPQDRYGSWPDATFDRRRPQEILHADDRRDRGLFRGEAERCGEPADARGTGRRLQDLRRGTRSEEHTSELQSLMRTSYAVFCLKKKTYTTSL